MATWTLQQAVGGTDPDGIQAMASVGAAGRLILLAQSHGAAETPATPTDTLSTTYTKLATVEDATNGVGCSWWYGITSAGGANTVQFEASASWRSYQALEYSVDAGTITLDVADDGNLRNHDATTDNIVSDAITTSVADCLVVGLNFDDDNSVTISAGTNFTKVSASEQQFFSGNPVTFEYLTKATAGSVTATYTSSGAGRGAAFVASFKASGGGGGTNATVDMTGVLAAATAAVVAPPKPRPAAPFSEINVRM